MRRLEGANEIVHIRTNEVNNTINSKKFTLLNDYYIKYQRVKTHDNKQKMLTLLNDCLKDINEVRGGEAQVQSSDLHQL